MANAPLAAVVAYLVGTFPTAAIVGRLTGHDVASEGSGNPGASNVYRLAGARAGAVVFAGDLAKGFLAAAAGLLVGGRPLALACGVAAVLGHCFPVTRRFRGGKGVATAAGFVLAIEPLVAAGAVLTWFLLARLVGRASVASLVVTAGVPAAIALRRGAGASALVVAAVAVLIVLRHADNLRRLVRGEERTLG